MTRPLRIECAGAVYHITSRGNTRQAIFTTEKEFADFLFVLCQTVKRYHFILIGQRPAIKKGSQCQGDCQGKGNSDNPDYRLARIYQD
ncbi:hypothetical protein KJ813_02710 [bacterium]|nr:hypothetical protein [bacterium]MBU4361559.1 hypothetical protein [bacterium]MBU4602120.1 hypothetical protein [bacterium]